MSESNPRNARNSEHAFHGDVIRPRIPEVWQAEQRRRFKVNWYVVALCVAILAYFVWKVL